MTTSGPSTLVLFDIDGTLIQSGRAGLRGMNAAFDRLYRAPGALDHVPFAGRTDRAIVADALRGIGLEASDDNVRTLRDAYLEDLRVEMGRPTDLPSRVLSGVVELLDALAARPGVRVGLLTGNFAGGAEIKLGHFGLWTRFGWGAFGDEHADRRALVPVALAEAARAGWAGPSDAVCVIGDTPLDVDCARAHGARALAVATGPFGPVALEAAGAHCVVPSLTDTPALLAWLTSQSPG